MNIGEIAQIAQVTPRAIRHYHRVGALPEPRRLSNGYRSYSVLDLTRLLRLRRLLALGVPLKRVGAAVSDSPEAEVNSDLAEIEGEIREQIRVLQHQLDAVVAARTTRLPEATAVYDADNVAVRELLAIPEIFRLERDVTLLLEYAGDTDTLQRLRDGLSDPSRLDHLAGVSKHLLSLSTTSSPDECTAVADELFGVLHAWSDLSVDPRLAELAEEYLDRAFNATQVHVLQEVSARLASAHTPKT